MYIQNNNSKNQLATRNNHPRNQSATRNNHSKRQSPTRITNLNRNSKHQLATHMGMKNLVRLGATSKEWAKWARKEMINKRYQVSRVARFVRNFSKQRGPQLAVEHPWNPRSVMAYRGLMAARHAAPEINMKPYMKNVYNRFRTQPENIDPNGGYSTKTRHIQRGGSGVHVGTGVVDIYTGHNHNYMSASRYLVYPNKTRPGEFTIHKWHASIPGYVYRNRQFPAI
jgi:hypothetical protein